MGNGALGFSGISIGNTVTSQSNSVSIGNNSGCSYINSVAIGYHAIAGTSGQLCFNTSGTSTNSFTTSWALTSAATVSDTYLSVVINGTPYKLLLHT